MFNSVDLLFKKNYRVYLVQGDIYKIGPFFIRWEKPCSKMAEWFNSMDTNFWNRSNVTTLVIKVKIKNGKKKDSKLPSLRLILSNWSYLLAKKLSLKMSGLNLMRYLTFILGQNEKKKIETSLFLHSKIVKWLWFKLYFSSAWFHLIWNSLLRKFLIFLGFTNIILFYP